MSKLLSLWTLLGGCAVITGSALVTRALQADGPGHHVIKSASSIKLTPAQVKETADSMRESDRLEGIGWTKEKAGDFAGAADAYRKALRLPFNAGPILRVKLARALEKMGPSEEALAALRDSLKPHTSSLAEDPRELTSYGEMALSLHHNDEATEAFRRAIACEKQPTSYLPRIEPKTRTLSELQASAHVACGFKDMYQTSNAAAEAQFARALAIVPDWPAVQLYRAENIRRQGKRDDAREQFRLLTGSRDKQVGDIAAQQLKRLESGASSTSTHDKSK